MCNSLDVGAINDNTYPEHGCQPSITGLLKAYLHPLLHQYICELISPHSSNIRVETA